AGARSWELLVVEREAAILAVDRHQAPREVAAFDGAGRLALAVERKRIDVGPRDAFHAGDRIGAHALLRLGMPGAQAQVAAVHHRRAVAAPVAGHRHHLRAAGDDEVFHPRHDLGGAEGDRGDPRAAIAIEGHARGPDVVAGVERGHAAEVARLVAYLGAGAPDDVIDVGGAK